MAKYDWITLEREFMTLKKYAKASLREFAVLKGIPYTTHYQSKTKGWVDVRKAKQRQTSGKIERELEAREISREVAAAERHLLLWERFICLVETAIGDSAQLERLIGADNPHRAIKSLADVLEKAQKGQRLSLGMDKDTVTIGGNIDIALKQLSAEELKSLANLDEKTKNTNS